MNSFFFQKISCGIIRGNAAVAELVDALALGASTSGCEGSIPFCRTNETQTCIRHLRGGFLNRDSTPGIVSTASRGIDDHLEIVTVP